MENRKNIKVFIVDDSPMCRFLYKRHLMNLGFSNIYLFESGEQCLNNIHIMPEIVLLDFDAPPRNGLEVLKEIKQMYPQIHLLMISSQQDINVVIEAIRFGVSGYIMKDDHQLEMMSYATEKILNENKFLFVG
ncbi:MAG: response regulator [Taibaiella sp.]|nr:response regulator [Taibaiella sp.]